jgi:sialate O-acetylesterase
MCKRLVCLLIGVIAFGLSSLGWADVSVPTMFSDHAVLQRNMSVPVWGTASPGEHVTVSFGGQSENTEASVSGDWMIYLAPMPESSSPTDMVITGNNVITITGVQVGEVWVGSGQSNMYNPLSGDCGASSAIETSGNFNIRLFNVGSGTPDGTVWEVSTSILHQIDLAK